jgi:hypothetical protein
MDVWLKMSVMPTMQGRMYLWRSNDGHHMIQSTGNAPQSDQIAIDQIKHRRVSSLFSKDCLVLGLGMAPPWL